VSGICTRQDCDVASGMPCEMGTRDFRSCPHFQARTEPTSGTESSTETPDDGSGLRLPWTGRSLGLADMTLASSRGPARLVGLIGPFNAGKTGLLTAIFAHFASEGVVDGYNFAGSFTLQGWSQLKDHTTWPSPHGGMFPPHTPDTGQRSPSLLHLAFRRGGEMVRDLLFTDAPGEWFTRWLSNEAADNAAGARWIAENATHFVFVVDREGLAGANVGRIRNATLALARRLSESLRGRPVIAVWTKSDVRCDEDVEAPVRARLTELFGEHYSLNLHVKDPACVNLLGALLQQTPRATHLRTDGAPASAFLAFRGVIS
jgi:hypothetical protein